MNDAVTRSKPVEVKCNAKKVSERMNESLIEYTADKFANTCVQMLCMNQRFFGFASPF